MISKGFSQEGRSFYGSFESNGIYYQNNENETYNEQFASNNYLNLKYILSHFTIGKINYKLMHKFKTYYDIFEYMKSRIWKIIYNYYIKNIL